MRKLIIFFIIFFELSIFLISPVFADTVISGEIYDISRDTFISKEYIIDMDKINIIDSVSIKNQGSIYGDINVCAGCNLQIQNSGVINGAINIDPTGAVVQVIKNKSDLTRLNVNGPGFSLLVQNTDPLRLTDIMNLYRRVDKITLDNASIIFEEVKIALRSLAVPNIELVGEITVEIDDPGDMNGRPILSNVSGDGVIDIKVNGLDPLYVASTYRVDNNVFLSILRETDYVKIFDSEKIGKFLNQLRAVYADNPTLAAMDRAATMSDLMRAADKSVMLNPMNLMKPIRTFNDFETNPVRNADASAVDMIYILSDDFGMYAAFAAAAKSINRNLDLSISGYMGMLENVSELNDFSGMFYGGNVRGRYDDDSVWIDSVVGATVAAFETDVIFDGTGISYDPNGFSIYGNANIGTKFSVGENFDVSPFIGLGGELDQVLHQSDANMFAHVGAIAGFTKTAMGITNGYKAFANIRTDNSQAAGFIMDFWSDMDNAGVKLEYSFIHDKYGFAHKLSVGIKTIF